LISPVRAGDRVVLVDFGLSRLRSSDAPTRSIGGTPAYMAPEQLRNGRVDARSDLFAAALVLVTLLTGWRRRGRDELAPSLDGIEDAALRETLRRALAIEPALRFQTAAELSAALETVQPDISVQALPRALGASRGHRLDGSEIDDLLETALYLHSDSAASDARLSETTSAREGMTSEAALSAARRRFAIVAAAVVSGGAVAAFALHDRQSAAPERLAGVSALASTPPPPQSAPAAASAAAASLPSVVIGGSGTLLWGFFAPMNAFLEEVGEVTIPITSQNDLGSGGAMDGLRAGKLDIAALSRRYDKPDAVTSSGSGKLLVEAAIGFDETSLFVWRDNPVRAIDLADVRAHLCCQRGTDIGELTWRDFGVTASSLARQPVTWLVFGRKRHPGTRETTSATLALADEWLCAPDRLCSSSISFDVQANDVLPALVTDIGRLALSSRSFATQDVAAVTLLDRAHHRRLDGRKVLWIYALVEAGRPMPAKLCRFFGAVLDPAVAGRLAASGKASGLPDPLRTRQRAALGLDDGACEHRTASDLVARGNNASVDRLTSPIATDVEVKMRWVRDP
jgi:ABC-type phosphate transport system substrate-binding protein